MSRKVDRVALVFQNPLSCSECLCYRDGKCRGKTTIGRTVGNDSIKQAWCPLHKLKRLVPLKNNSDKKIKYLIDGLED